jgi:hypothetical protein
MVANAASISELVRAFEDGDLKSKGAGSIRYFPQLSLGDRDAAWSYQPCSSGPVAGHAHITGDGGEALALAAHAADEIVGVDAKLRGVLFAFRFLHQTIPINRDLDRSALNAHRLD